MKTILKKIIHFVVWKFNPIIIVVVGNYRNLAKEAIYSVLKNKMPIKKSKGDINKLMFSAFFCLSKKVLILEYSIDESGDAKNFFEFARPKIVVMADSESADNGDAKEKIKLIEDLKTSDFAIIDFNNKAAPMIREKTRAKIITFGLVKNESEQKPDFQILNFEEKYENEKPISIAFKLEYKSSFVPVIIDNVSEKNYAYATAIGAILGTIYDLNLVEAVEKIDGAFV